jgi:hypothetical protein
MIEEVAEGVMCSRSAAIGVYQSMRLENPHGP